MRAEQALMLGVVALGAYAVYRLPKASSQSKPLPPDVPVLQGQPAVAVGPDEPLTLANLGSAFRQVTPSLLVVGIATGAAFAIGGGLASRYVLERGKRS